jgi:hypothetical protein
MTFELFPYICEPNSPMCNFIDRHIPLPSLFFGVGLLVRSFPAVISLNWITLISLLGSHRRAPTDSPDAPWDWSVAADQSRRVPVRHMWPSSSLTCWFYLQFAIIYLSIADRREQVRKISKRFYFCTKMLLLQKPFSEVLLFSVAVACTLHFLALKTHPFYFLLFHFVE